MDNMLGVRKQEDRQCQYVLQIQRSKGCVGPMAGNGVYSTIVTTFALTTKESSAQRIPILFGLLSF